MDEMNKDGEDEKKLRDATLNLKKNVEHIQKKIHQQDLLLETIVSSTHENSTLMARAKSKLYKAVETLKKDSRNYAVFSLLAVSIVLIYYLLP
jgi:t-SNARE complex subunit (syntaxin)